MQNEAIIRSEANSFIRYKLDSAFSRVDGHRQFIDNLRMEMNNFYSPESKMIYLDETKKCIQKKQDEHNKDCPKGPNCGTDLKYQALHFFIDQEIQELPKIIHKKQQQAIDRTGVFISYSHQDADWLKRLRRHFKPLEDRVDFWEDSRIRPGQKWKSEIEKALAKARVAILLVSADFFNSDFIANNELPPLLEAADNQGATILTLILKPCLFEEYPQICQFQAMNSPSKTLIQMSEAEQELTFVELIKQIKDIVKR